MHINLCKCYHDEQHASELYGIFAIAMELCECSLQDYVSDHKQELGFGDRIDFCTKATLGVQALHLHARMSLYPC